MHSPMVGFTHSNVVLLIFTFNRQMAPLTDTLPLASDGVSAMVSATVDRML